MKKVALVTGGARGIGRAVVERLLKDGFRVVCNYNTSFMAANELINKYGTDNILVLKADVSNEAEVKRMVEEAINTFGQIDVLVNNAAVSLDSLFQDKSVESFRKTFDVNVIGTYLVSKYVGEHMYNRKSGKIINLSSTNGINTYYPMCMEYDASKSAINSLTHNLAIQFAPYITVNAVAPGFIKTESEIKDMDEEFIREEENKILVNRAGEEEDVADLISFLASNQSDYINNQIIRIDGGMYGG
ncbi:MAG: SDR family oxidoreductase [Clostridia bacterium]|nr:SDR family oxidoreductase [Clostridia bacterium]